MSLDREQLRQRVAGLAAKGVFLGTSSWKYEGWRGLLYDESRYVYRGKFAGTRFEKNCLAEYAEVFKTVCVDAAFYKFPDEKYLTGLVSQVPEDFQFAFKVTDEVTIKKFPNLSRHGARAGQFNEHFLDAARFSHAFIKPCEAFRKQIGLLIFEFSRFYATDYEHGRGFRGRPRPVLGHPPPRLALRGRNAQPALVAGRVLWLSCAPQGQPCIQQLGGHATRQRTAGPPR